MKNFSLVILSLIILTIAAVVYIWDARQDRSLQVKAPLPVQTNMKIESPVFNNDGSIPAKYTCDGDNISPPLLISEVSDRARSLVLIVSDPDAPGGDWVHWTMWNIPANISEIAEGELPAKASEGANDFGEPGYGGPCPPSGEHHYVFKLYAIGSELYLDASATRADLLQAMDEYIIETAELIGTYQRN